MPETLLEEEKNLSTFKELLFKKLHKDPPTLFLSDIPQWSSFIKGMDLKKDEIGHLKTYLLNGFFYNFSSPLPSSSQIKEALKESNHCDFIMIPLVRRNDEHRFLKELGFFEIPMFTESILKLEPPLQNQLKKFAGSKQIKNLRRLSRYAQEEFTLQIFKTSAFYENMKAQRDFIALHKMNAFKYKHPLNLYDEESIDFLIKSPLRENIGCAIRYTKENHIPVQAALLFFDEKRRHIYVMCQGIDPLFQRPPQNLYMSLFFDLFSWAENHNYQEIHLGRGSLDIKKKLGCNIFYELFSFIKPLSNVGAHCLKNFLSSRNFL